MLKEKLITKNTCKHCGKTGLDVGLEMVYIGGKGYVPVMVCNDGVQCWKRWNKKGVKDERPSSKG